VFSSRPRRLRDAKGGKPCVWKEASLIGRLISAVHGLVSADFPAVRAMLMLLLVLLVLLLLLLLLVLLPVLLRLLVLTSLLQVKQATAAEWWAHCRPHASGHQMHYDSDAEGQVCEPQSCCCSSAR